MLYFDDIDPRTTPVPLRKSWTRLRSVTECFSPDWDGTFFVTGFCRDLSAAFCETVGDCRWRGGALPIDLADRRRTRRLPARSFLSERAGLSEPAGTALDR